MTTRLGVAWEWSTSVVVHREGNFTRSDQLEVILTHILIIMLTVMVAQVDEVEVFKGSENNLQMMQTYTHRFQCNFVLTRYPFDTQANFNQPFLINVLIKECFILMTVNSLDKETVELVSSTLWMEEQLDLTLFHITNFTLGPANASDPKQGVKMVTRMRRKVTTEMMTTYFPTILLMAITYATTFFKPIFFEASLTVNLTTMLVMTTIFISKMESLPPTSDIKMIDVWLILCQLVPFIEAVMLTAIEYHRETDHVDLVNPGSKTRRANSKLFGKLSQKLEIVGGVIIIITSLCSLHKYFQPELIFTAAGTSNI